MTKEYLPKRYHYSNSRRIEDIVLDVADEYYVSKFVTLLYIYSISRFRCINNVELRDTEVHT